MCGIVGYVGSQLAVPVLLNGLKKQEYRGYDSAGVALLDADGIEIRKSLGKIALLEEKLAGYDGKAYAGIGHTRWATHGKPSERNSHPHADCSGRIAVVHNGIIENYIELREWLEEEGHVFKSETDTEVLPHLIEQFYKGDFQQAVREALSRVRGSYAFIAICADEPDSMIAVRKDNPLIIGVGEGEYILASDIPALLDYTRRIVVLMDGDMAVIKKGELHFYNNGLPIEKEITEINWDAEAAQKAGYPHYMLKEIWEQPHALRETMMGRISPVSTEVQFDSFHLTPEEAAGINRIFIVGCGTAYHAGIVGKYTMEKLLRIHVCVDIASEFRYRDPLVDEHTLLVIISQSGETADTLAAMREGKRKGARTVAITNVMSSTIAREADDVIYTYAGPEIAVASTKAYITQLAVIYMLTLYLAQQMKKMSSREIRANILHMLHLPEQVEEILTQSSGQMKEMAERIAKHESVFFVGRGMDFAVAQEGSLKLKEISYIHAESYAAGELKHGTLALIVDQMPVIALCTQSGLFGKMVSNIREIKARGAQVMGVAFDGNSALAKVADTVLYLPATIDLLAPILTVVPLQLLSYYAAVLRGCDVDQPRNLAKSVTVE